MTSGDTARAGDDLRRAIASARDDHERYLTHLAEAGGIKDQPRAANAPVVVANTALADETRIEVLRRMSATLGGRGEHIETLMTVVGDGDDSPAVRAAALDLLAAAAFQVALFAPYRGRYEDLLRTLLTDPVEDLRRFAAGTLALAHDPQLQDVLERGLRYEETLPVERHHAIRMLAADDHRDNRRWLDELYRDGDEAARLDAVRYLGSYSDAGDDLERVLRDGNESTVVRQQAGASLRYLAPERFGAVAKEIALDATDDPEVRVACLTTLRYFGADDTDFVERVRALSEGEGEVAQAARGLVEHRAGA